MKKTLFPLFIFFVIIGLFSCDPENVIQNNKIDSDTLDYVWDTTKVTTITLNNNLITTSNTNKVSITGSIATISSKGTYEISGTLTNGQIVVNTEGIVRLVLKNAQLNCATSSPVYVINADKTIIISPENTINSVTDGNSYIITTDSLNAAIYSKDYLAFYGTGKLTINGNYKGAVYSKDELIIESADLTVNSVDFGLKGKDYLQINDGKFNINSTGDALKSDKDSVSDKGYILIKNGDFQINTGSDAISATDFVDIYDGKFQITSGGGCTVTPSTISTKGIKGKNINIKNGIFTINSSDNSIDANNNLKISGGSLVLYSGNKPLESDSTLTIDDGTVDIQKAVKGISSHDIFINGGKTSVYSTNDCLKATLGLDLTTDDGSYIEINGGKLILKTDKGDALDSNGSLKINGGLIVVQGSPTSPDDAVSYRGTCAIRGGSLIASGARTLIPTQSVTSQNTVMIRFSTLILAGQIINIQDTNGVSVLSYKTSKYAYYLLASLPAFTTGTTYNVYLGGTLTGTDLNGYYSDGVYTNGSKKGSFTISNVVTSVVL